jgi:RNA polymerase sigma-70 factor (ECF subfamily)
MNLTDHRDQLLIEQLQQGKERAFDVIYDLYWKPLFQYAYKRLESAETAKDLVQDIFICLWNKKDALKLTSSLSAYLFSMLRFKLIDYYHAGEVRKRYASDADKINHLSFDDAGQKVNLGEINNLLNLSMQTLPDKMKEIFELSRIKGYSTRQISEQLSISEQTVKNQLSTALRRLKLSFTDYLVIAIVCFLLR